MRLLERWRHAWGFGIHSPFAYRVIRDVLREQCPYYAYSLLPSQRERLMYRIAVAFQPSMIKAIGGADAKAALMAAPKGKERRPPHWVDELSIRLAVAGKKAKAAEIAALARDGWVVLSETGLPDAASSALNEIGHGMTFSNRSGLSLIVPFAHLPRQDHRLYF